MTDNHAPTQTHRHNGLALAIICIAQLMVVLDATVMNVALTKIQGDLHFSNSGLTWVITAYSLTFGGLLLFGGRLGDLYGRRKMFVAGITLFGLASLAGGLAQTESWLIIARAVQGMGGAIAAPTALALIATTFREGEERNRAFGLYAAMAASGAAVGLILGGVLTDVASWRWALFINVPIALFVFIAAPRVLGDSKGSGTKLDVPGALTVTGGMISLVYGMTNAATNSWGDTNTIVALVASAVLLVAFVLIEARTAAPLLPFRILKTPARTGAYLTMLFLASALFATFFFTSQFFQIVEGWSPMKTGFAFLPMPLTIMFMSMVVVRRVVAKVGTRPLVVIGPILVTIAMVLLSQVDASYSYLQIIGSIMPLALGMGCMFVPLTMTAVAGVAHYETGLASALLNTGQQLGGAVGLAVLGTVAASADKDRAHHLIATHGPQFAGTRSFVYDVFVHGQSAAFHGAIVLAAMGVVVSVVLIRTKHQAQPPASAGPTPTAEPVIVEV